MLNKSLFTSNTNEWSTPQDFFNTLDKEFHFTLDPCATKQNAKCPLFFTDIENGLIQNYNDEIVLCNPCNLICGITENSVNLYNGYKKMFQMQNGKDSEYREFSNKQENEQWVGLLVQRVPCDSSKNENEKIPKNSTNVRENNVSKKETYAEQKRDRNEKKIFSNIKSQKKTITNEYGMELDNTRLGEVQAMVGEQVCILRKGERTNTRSFLSFNGQEMSWNNSRKYGTSLYVLQHKQTAQRSILVVQKKGHTCPNCGLSTVIKKHTIFINPPYGKVLKDWVKKASEAKHSTVVLLIPSRTDTRYFHDYIYNKQNTELRFIKGRLKFGNSTNSAPFPSLLVIYKNI